MRSKDIKELISTMNALVDFKVKMVSLQMENKYLKEQIKKLNKDKEDGR